jgi:arylsulfatase A-like enzyme
MGRNVSKSRREFLRNAALVTGAVVAGAAEGKAAGQGESKTAARPNVLMICSDQFRTDFVGANGKNPSVKTPNLDALAARGTNFRTCVSNQPLCSPSRASFMSGMYANRTGVFRLGLEPDHTFPSIATVLKKAGYGTHFIGKWHVSGSSAANPEKRIKEANHEGLLGWIAPGPSRWEFDTWEGANVLERASHPTYGNYWDDAGNNIGFKDEYRVDFITDRAVKLLEAQTPDKPWLLFLSQLEPHQQNDVDDMVPPQRYEGHYDNAFVPQDLRDLPGNWNSRLKGYYGCVQAIDDCVGRVVATLEKTGQLENTIIVFFSDHGCTFRTRLGEYKRSPHDASIRVPMIFAGPGFDHATAVDEVVSLLDLTPTLIDGCHVDVPSSMQGKSLAALPTEVEARKAWDATAYIQISASMVGRAIRDNDWVFCAYDPDGKPEADPVSTNYLDFCMYQVGADPYQKVNLIGRPEYAAEADKLRAELKRRILANGEPEPTIKTQHYYV